MSNLLRYRNLLGVFVLFMFKRGALLFSMLMLANINGNSDDFRSFFASWFVFFLLLVMEFVENLHFKFPEDNQPKSFAGKVILYYYLISIIVFSLLGTFFLLGSFGFIIINSDLTFYPNSGNIIINGIFNFLGEPQVYVETFILLISLLVLGIGITEFFVKPNTSYKEKYNAKQKKKKEAAS